MIISPISPVTTSTLQAVSAINSGTIKPLFPITSSNPGLLDSIRGDNITVDVSPLGELLAYTARLQSRQTANVSATVNAANQTDTAQTKADIAQITAIATSFVAAFNQLQASNSSLTENPLIPDSSDSLLQVMNAGAQNADGSSLFEQLADIGINLQNAAQPDSNSLLMLDVNAFQNALTAKPEGTATLLTQALQVLGSAESTVLTQNQELASGNLLATVAADATNASATENTDVANSISTSNANTNDVSTTVSPDTLNEAAVNAPADTAANASTTSNTNTSTADIQLQQTLEDEALRAAIDITRNSQAVGTSANTESANNATQAAPGIPPTPATSTANLSATNNVAASIQSNIETTNTPAEATTIIPAPDTSTDASSAALNTQAIAEDTSTNATATATTDATDLAANASSQALNTQTTTQTTTQAATPTATQTLSSDNLDSTTPQGTLAAENKLAANATTPSSLLTESQLENQVAAKSTKLNENAASDADSSATINNGKATAATPSTFDEVSKTLDTINQATVAANNIAANSQAASANPVSTTVVTPVANATAIEQTTPVSNSAVITANAVTSIQASINPLISAAVAAYRVKDGIQADSIDKLRSAESDEVTAPEPVTVVEPVTLDLHEHAQSQRHDAEADAAYHQAEELGEPEKEDAAGNINVNI
ncbi:hypothetical protein ACO0LG_20755 [Undibacterium sp. Ji42W]|uniref:hypothetical protein n=1 Tax=Undibacterium sp. Ji42W TaxID=3413039 RepID=UPI003BF395B0